MEPRSPASLVLAVSVALAIGAWTFSQGAEPYNEYAENGEETSIAAEFAGQWELVAERSTPVDPWRNLQLELSVNGSEVRIHRIWSAGPRNRHVDSLTVSTDGVPVTDRIHHWDDSRHLGLYVGPDSTRTATAHTLDHGRTLRVETEQTLHTSQGAARVRVYSEYRVSADGNELALLELRSSRTLPIHFLFRRAEGSNE